MLELFGFAWVTITFTCCVAAVSTRRSVLRWVKARADRKRLDDTVEIVRRPLRRLATYAALVVLAVPAGVYAGGGALPGPLSAAFTGGTVANAVVLTGNNSGGTGTLRIRPSDEDAQVVLCEASNNAATEVCSSFQHYNFSSSSSGFDIAANAYLDTSGVYQRYNTSFGYAAFYAQAGSAAASNLAGIAVFGTGGAAAGSAAFAVTGASASTFTIGGTGTVSTDIRGPVSNGGSATCGGVNAGDVCLNEGATTNGRHTSLLMGTVSNCSDGAGAAACSAAPAGSVVIDDGATTVVVSTTAVTANSQIFPMFDSSLGTKLGVTCNTTAVTPSISARTAGTSFTITAADPAGANPACFSYFILN